MSDASARQYAPWLWTLLALFAVRVAGQLVVALTGASWLPPMGEWYSGLIPYPLLLLSQVLIIALLGWICLDFSTGSGYFVTPRAAFARPALLFGYVYLAVTVIRYPLRMYLHPEARWFGQTIPIFFHWVLAAFVIVFARYHLARVRSSAPSPGDSPAAFPVRSESRERSGS